MSTSTQRFAEAAATELAGGAAWRVTIRGRVQGVGFRPAVYRLATDLGATGSVSNSATGVEIRLQVDRPTLRTFLRRLQAELPPTARIDSIDVEPCDAVAAEGFAILPSRGAGSLGVRLPADVRICPDCRDDVRGGDRRRAGYAFPTCSTCGPRYSVIESLPYDRPATSLRDFPLCVRCRSEYESPGDRRFHAQSMACPGCGPRLTVQIGRDPGGTNDDDQLTAIHRAVETLRAGGIVALKGLGGYQLLVRADDAAAVRRLRERKRRPAKPLAVMVANLAAAETIANLNDAERRVLDAPENPIVIAARRTQNSAIAPDVAPGLRAIGVFLPTTPLHEILIERLGVPVVATSGNRSEEPPAIENHDAHSRLSDIADLFLDHDRRIIRRLDDSVVRVIANQPVVLRLARGYAPCSLEALEGRTGRPALAVGGHLKSSIAAFTGQQALLAQHVGDLDDSAARREWESVVVDLQRLLQFQPEMIACDMHPDYFTTRWAERRGLPVVPVQHHHAHAAAVQAEFGLLSYECLALAWDGVGFGPDGTLWGGELLRTRPDGEFQRLASLRPIALLGGEAAIRQPARIGFALLCDAVGPENILRDEFWLRRLQLDRRSAGVLAQMAQRGTRTIWSSGVGRLFDGVAAMALGIATVSFEGEAALRLEDAADAGSDKPYPLPTMTAAADQPDGPGVALGDWRPMIAEIADDVRAGVEPGKIAGRFHSTLAHWAADLIGSLAPRPIVLAGGCFQNRRLAENVIALTSRAGRSVFLPSRIPPGDGGLAAGQLAVAMQRDPRR